MDKLLPKAWEGLLNSSDFLPVIVKTLERIQDAAWSTEPNRHENYEMVYMKKWYAVFEISGHRVELG